MLCIMSVMCKHIYDSNYKLKILYIEKKSFLVLKTLKKTLHFMP